MAMFVFDILDYSVMAFRDISIYIMFYKQFGFFCCLPAYIIDSYLVLSRCCPRY